MRSLGIGTGSWTKACSQVIAPSTIHVRPNSTKQKKSVQRRSSFMSSGPVGARAYGVVNSGSAGTDEDDGFNGVVRMLKSLFKGVQAVDAASARSSSDRKGLSASRGSSFKLDDQVSSSLISQRRQRMSARARARTRCFASTAKRCWCCSSQVFINQLPDRGDFTCWASRLATPRASGALNTSTAAHVQ